MEYGELRTDDDSSIVTLSGSRDCILDYYLVDNKVLGLVLVCSIESE